MATEAERLQARGAPITLLDESVEHVVFSNAAVIRLEDEFGSLDDYLLAAGAGSGGKFGHFVSFVIRATMLDRKRAEQLNEDLIDTRRYREYVEAFDKAWEQAFPRPTEVPAGNASAAMNGSHGPVSTTSQPSDLVAATSSSGA